MRTLTLVSNNADRSLKFEGQESSYDEQRNNYQSQDDVSSIYNWKVKELTSVQIGRISDSKKVAMPYGVLALVVCAHVIAVLALINAKATLPVIKDLQAPMLVSLVASPALEPKVIPLITTPPQSVVKKQKSVIENVQSAPASAAATQEIVQPEVTESPPIPAEPIVVAKASEVIETPQPAAEPVVEPPRFGAAYLNNPAPDYPNMARRLGQQGRVLLKVLVAENGTAETVVLATSSGFEKLDKAALEAVKKWSFIPAKRSNQPVSAYVLVPVKFSLNN